MFYHIWNTKLQTYIAKLHAQDVCIDFIKNVTLYTLFLWKISVTSRVLLYWSVYLCYSYTYVYNCDLISPCLVINIIPNSSLFYELPFDAQYPSVRWNDGCLFLFYFVLELNKNRRFLRFSKRQLVRCFIWWKVVTPGNPCS